MEIEKLEKKLNNGELDSIYLLYGEEQYLLETIVKKIKKLFGETVKGINYILLDETNIEQVISDIETPAFGYEKKLIIAKNTGLFKKEVKKNGEKLSNLKEKLNEYINQNIDLIKKTTIIVFIEDSASKFKLYNTIEKNGIVCEFAYQKPIQIIKRLKSICNAYKVNVDEGTLQYFIECCGTNMQNLINEIRKLIEYVGENGTIKKENIDKLSIKQLESIIFEVTDSLSKKDVKNALIVINNLIASKEPIQKIFITLYNHFKKLYITKICIKENIDLAENLNLKANQMFLVNKYKTQARFFEQKELRKLLQELVDLDYKYKIGLVDLNIGLEAILCTYCS